MENILTLSGIFQAFDTFILEYLNSWVGINPILDEFLEISAAWTIYFIPVFLVVAWFWIRYSGKIQDYVTSRVELLELTIAGLFAWQVLSRIIKVFWFRERPYTAEDNVKELFFHRPDESFPSDHTAFLVAMAVYAYLLGWQRTSYFLGGLALLVSTTRIITGIHWTSDIVGGFFLGFIAAYLIYLFRVSLSRILRPLVVLVSKIGL